MPKICEGCEENNAVVHCLDCGADWCEECDTTTHRLKKFQSHKRVPLTSGSPPPLTAAEPEVAVPEDDAVSIDTPLALTWATESVNCEANGGELRKVGGRNFCFDGHIWANEQIPVGVVSGYTLRVKGTMMGAAMIGIAPGSAVREYAERLYQNAGWYFYGADFKAYSGLPNLTPGKDVISGTAAAASAAYNNRNLRRGDEVTVIVDTRAEDVGVMYVSVNKGPQIKVFDNIPLGEPLVPTVEFFGKTDILEVVN